MDNEDLKKIGESGFPVAFEQAMAIMMNELCKLVEPECLVTILIRHPNFDDRDICWTMDDLFEAVPKMLERCNIRERQKRSMEETPK